MCVFLASNTKAQDVLTQLVIKRRASLLIISLSSE